MKPALGFVGFLSNRDVNRFAYRCESVEQSIIFMVTGFKENRETAHDRGHCPQAPK